MSARTTELDTFFPLPSDAPSTGSPARLPGITRTSSEALIKVLKDNHVKWHAFFNDRGFHNHASHHMVAIYAMGAAGPLIEEAYQTHVVYMKPAFESPETVTEENFWKHVGKREFYNSYLEFFRALLLKKDVSDVLEEYIFSAKANVGGKGIEGQPMLLNRFLASIVHPMIHVSCGLEFGLLGLVAEGLAQSAVHPADGDHLIPATLFQSNTSPHSPVSRLSTLLPSLTLRRNSKTNVPTDAKANKTGAHAFDILARMLADDKFAPASLKFPLPEGDSQFGQAQVVLGDAFVELTNQWAAEFDADGPSAAIIAKKIEELAWMNALIYGVPGWAHREKSPTKQFNADFFYMHLVTSSIFLPALVQYLSPSSAVVLLRAYFSVSIGWYVAQGRPALPIKEFYENTTDKPVQPGEPHIAPAKDTLTPSDASPNPWLPIVQTTIVHPAEHLCKIQRALMHNATLYGTKTAGDFSGLELEGAELLDGTLFIRIAALTADRIGWMREGQEAGNWDRMGFF